MNPSTLSLNWQTIGGRRVGHPTSDFWPLWKRNRSEVEAAGITVGQFDADAGDYQLIWTPKSGVPDWVNEKLRDYQRPAVATLVEGVTRWGRVFDGSELGTGKTYSALATVAAIGKQPFVICRKAAIPDWKRVGKLFGFNDLEVMNYEALKTGKHLEVAQWVLEKARNGRSYDKFKWFLPPDQYVIIFDECHWVKSPLGTQNSKIHLAHTLQGYQSCNLSATAANQPLHLKALGYALGLHKVNNFYTWLFSYGYEIGTYGLEWNCGLSTGERFEFVNGKFVERPEASEKLRLLRREHMARIHHSIFDCGKGVRLRKRDIPGFPVTQILPVLMDFGKAATAIRASYDRMREQLKSCSNSDARGVMVREAMCVEKLKMPVIADEIKESVAEGLSVVVFVNYNESMDYLMIALKTKCVVRGDMKEADRRTNIDAFQDNRESVILCNSQCGGESLNLHDCSGEHPRTSIVMPSHWSEKMKQCFGRIDRNGVKDVTVQKVPFCDQSIEVDMMEGFASKIEFIEMLTDGDLQACLGI